MSTLRVEGSHPGLYAWRLDEMDWYDPVVLACAMQWPEYVVGWSELSRGDEVRDLLGAVRVTVAGAVALVAKSPERLGQLLELLVRAEIHEPS